MMTAELCADCALAGAWEEALAYAQQVLSIRSGTFVFSTRLMFWYETEAFVRAGEIEQASEQVRYYGEYIGNSRRYRIPYLRALAVLTKSHREFDAAIRYLREAEKLAEEIGLPGESWSIEAALGDLYLARDNAEQAHSAYKQAAAIVQQLIEALGNEVQRTTFLSSPIVQRVLKQAHTGE